MMDAYHIRFRTGAVKSSTGVKVFSGRSGAVITYDTAKVTKADVYKLLRAQLMYFESRIIERIIPRLPKDKT